MGLRDILQKEQGAQPPTPQPQAAPQAPMPEAAPRQPFPDGQAEPSMGQMEDALRSVVSGGIEGSADLVGQFGDTGAYMREGLTNALTRMGFPEQQARISANAYVKTLFPGGAAFSLPTTKTMRKMIPTAVMHEPQTAAGDIAHRAGYMAPSMMFTPNAGSMVNRGLSTLGAAALGHYGREGGEQTADYLEKNYKLNPKYRSWIEGGGDVLGTMAGSFAPEAIRKVITPYPAAPDRQKMVYALEQEGVPMTAGQKTGDEGLHQREALRSPSDYGEIRSAQEDAFSKGALNKAGVPNAHFATPDVLKKQRTVLGQEFDRLQNYGMQPDSSLVYDLTSARDNYLSVNSPTTKAPLVENMVQDILDEAQKNPNGISGDWLRNMGSKLRREIDRLKGVQGKDDVVEALEGIREAIDDNVERTIASANPADLGAYRDVREKYRNLIMLEEAAAGSTTGKLSPADLTRATKKMEGRRGYSRGYGPLNNYSRAGANVLTDPRTSKTAENASQIAPALKSVLGTGGVAGGLTALFTKGDPYLTAAAMGAGSTLDFARNKLRMSAAGQAYLANQLAGKWDLYGTAGRVGKAAMINGRRMNEENK